VALNSRVRIPKVTLLVLELAVKGVEEVGEEAGEEAGALSDTIAVYRWGVDVSQRRAW
jgi:hypothetical protein